MLGVTKWYLGMRIRQENDHTSIDQDQFIRNIISKFEKAFKHPFKNKVSPYQLLLYQARKTVHKMIHKSRKSRFRFGNLNYKSVFGALLYISCCTRPDIAYDVNKWAKLSNNLCIIHFRCLLHLVGLIKNTSSKGLKFFFKYEDSSI